MSHSKKTPAILVGKGLPNYKEITPKQILKYIPSLLKELSRRFESLERTIETSIEQEDILSWDSLMRPLQEISEQLRWSWGVVAHLNAVCNSEEHRDVYASLQPDIVRFSNRIGQSKNLFKAISILESNEGDILDETQQRIIHTEILSMKQRGVGLEKQQREQFNINSERLAELSTKFGNNVLDATKKWALLITDKSEVKGVPHRILEALAKAAKDSKDMPDDPLNEPTAEEGPWLIGLDMPTYISIITYAESRSLRERVYKAYVSRASSGESNNKGIIEEILIIRNNQARLLGYKNWAEISLDNKMANNVEEIQALLEELRAASIVAAKKEIKQIQDIALRSNAEEGNSLAAWDISYWSEKLKQEQFNLNQEFIRPWFPLPQVLNGLFKLCGRLFDISIKPASENFPRWHEDVSLFDVLDSNGAKIASFYLDPYSRPESKRGGAWMDECLTRDISDKKNIILPVAYLICNQTPPVGDTPSLMSFEEVKTLFHEFGHGLQHMLTTVDYPQAAGINNVEWDAVELPSQFMENWCLDPTTIKEIAKHWETGAPLPEEEFEKLKLNQKFNSGLSTLRQIHFSITDIKLHSQWHKEIGVTPDEMRREIAKTTTVLPPISEDQFLCAFNHIFAGGYAAGYYSYKWAEVLSADAFSAFEEVGLDKLDEIKRIGKRFRETVLSQGGSRHPSEIYKLFRGRPATTKALIRHSGL
ncbi:M3 family metallopeptidase [Prochlorococcus marinus]|uniref:oligopeptidase A n=1 Tax=Prochlorococcus marinus (strain MIT 9211) TaxID=93059 RepID=A9BAX6_PROM4|nr:M3 family metallopeptidase [Prochlorococcus marinus]ABX08988.1 Peptidase family M3 [Prochlorococcus marinus str. MIT 9211]